jgi:hypothetical protein
MVSPTEIDADLEEDVLEECTRYGKVEVKFLNSFIDKYRFVKRT